MSVLENEEVLDWDFYLENPPLKPARVVDVEFTKRKKNMGEAKRRKALGLGPKTVKSSNEKREPVNEVAHASRFSLSVSKMTGNWLIMIDGCYCYDSAMRLSDAKKVVNDLIEYEKNNPLPPLFRHIREEEYRKWAFKSFPSIQDVPSVIIVNGKAEVLDLNYSVNDLSQ